MTTPTDDLQQRCAEVIEWQRSDVLHGEALRNYAAKHWAGRHDSLQMAERDTSEQAMAAIAKWGQPQAVASGEPVKRVFIVATGEEHEGEATYTRYDDAPPPLCDSECLYTAPPPQAVREPLTPEQIKDEASHHGFIGSTDQLVKFVRGIEQLHGITKGGQHGAP